MFNERHDFTLLVDALSDLHIGDGATRTITYRDSDGKEQTAQVATVARDMENKPWLPATSLKGALRGLARDQSSRDLVFGTAHGSKDAKGGLLIIWGGKLANADQLVGGSLPGWDNPAAPCTWTGSHVSIDPRTGAAEAQRLYHRDYVPKGARFSIDVCWLGSLEQLQDHLLPLLGDAAAACGFSLGKASRAGFGRMRLVNSCLLVTSNRLTVNNGRPVITKSVGNPLDIPTAEVELQSLELHCPGPFMILDPMRKLLGDDDHVDFRTLQRDVTMPELLGTSLIGTLRKRAGWLQQLHLKDVRDAKFFGKPDDLTPVQRLFGLSGWAKQIRLVDIAMIECGSPSHAYPGIQLDDFTQGSIPGALFIAEAPADVRFRIDWMLEERHLTALDRELLAMLLADIAENGIKIGQKTGSGFGWFECPKEATDES